ncbi:UDP-N-acetylglucosamine diphosphorylase [Lawsonibacter sp. NSJ-52]|uniref:UDP-N-acetylglucosamine diphosphorylase n=1 Tax=Lawsonibacter faecis TaxID=2763052 RepID=A0A8J6JR79_9FIRM|nr:UDP-N-acetylglucosamine diphosphorylase [Lawsonibacter faecis]
MKPARSAGHDRQGRREELLLNEELMRRVREEAQARLERVVALMEAGVQVLDPTTVYLDDSVTVGKGTLLLPGTVLRGKTVIGENCEIGPNTMIRDCTVGDNVTVNASQLNESVVEDDVKIGPFAYIRPHCHVGKGVKVGDFVELKNSRIGAGTKISHLTYVGDSDVGSGVNFGCGTVTVNYDGTTKFRTTIGDGAFIGCNTNLVAPVRVGDGAYTAAGSTITEDVPDDSLAIARSMQVVKKQWAAKRRKR